MKTWLIISLVIELLISIALATAVCVYRRDQVTAYSAWHNNPTPQTQNELERQKRITGSYQIAFGTILFAVMAGTTTSLFYVYSKRRPSRSQIHEAPH